MLKNKQESPLETCFPDNFLATTKNTLNHSKSPLMNNPSTLIGSDFPKCEPSVQTDPSSPMADKHPTFQPKMGIEMNKSAWNLIYCPILPHKMDQKHIELAKFKHFNKQLQNSRVRTACYGRGNEKLKEHMLQSSVPIYIYTFIYLSKEV